MAKKAVFENLVFDEKDRPVLVTLIGEECCYVIDDDGFKRHVSSEQVDRQVFEEIKGYITGNEDFLSEQAAKMMGQDDIFSKALISNQLKQIEKQFDALLSVGIPEETRAYMGMVGFRIRVNVHGEVIDIEQPGTLGSIDDE